MLTKKLAKTVSICALFAALAGGTVAAQAQIMSGPDDNRPIDIKMMDTNGDKRVTKDEFLAAMGKAYDKMCGAKGWCTVEEMDMGMRKMPSMYIMGPAY